MALAAKDKLKHKVFHTSIYCDIGCKDDQTNASAGNRARVTSMATMYSTTRPLMLLLNRTSRDATSFYMTRKTEDSSGLGVLGNWPSRPMDYALDQGTIAYSTATLAMLKDKLWKLQVLSDKIE